MNYIDIGARAVLTLEELGEALHQADRWAIDAHNAGAQAHWDPAGCPDATNAHIRGVLCFEKLLGVVSRDIPYGERHKLPYVISARPGDRNDLIVKKSARPDQIAVCMDVKGLAGTFLGCIKVELGREVGYEPPFFNYPDHLVEKSKLFPWDIKELELTL